MIFNFELSTFHRRVLWVAAGVIGTFQTISIFADPEDHLNGMDWILAYVVVAGLIIVATAKKRPIHPNLATEDRQTLDVHVVQNLLDIAQASTAALYKLVALKTKVLAQVKATLPNPKTNKPVDAQEMLRMHHQQECLLAGYVTGLMVGYYKNPRFFNSANFTLYKVRMEGVMKEAIQAKNEQGGFSVPADVAMKELNRMDKICQACLDRGNQAHMFDPLLDNLCSRIGILEQGLQTPEKREAFFGEALRGVLRPAASK